jgi:hypothetical protein
MRSLITRLLIVSFVAALAVTLQSQKSEAAGGLKIEPMVWQLDRDYDGLPPDKVLPIDTVYIKTHDGTDWMSTYDDHPFAVSGPQSVHDLINMYSSIGIEVAAWFVPMGTDYETQLTMAKQVIDTGVTALYADVEPYDGFCEEQCQALATNFWTRLRQERPDARLGVIYDPRSPWRDYSGASIWMANSDVVMPMCYWDTFEGQGPWGDPAGCVAQAKADAVALVPGHGFEYIPVLQGDSTPEKMQAALDAAVRAGSERVSIWRRGVVPGDVWNLIANYQQPLGPHCSDLLVDGCLVREAMASEVYMIVGGAKFYIPGVDTFLAMGFNGRDVQVLPRGMLTGVPDKPRDGTLVVEYNGDTVFAVYGGAKFGIPGPEFETLGYNWGMVRMIPPGGLNQIGLVPGDYSRVRELSTPDDVHLVLNGARIQLDESGPATLSEAGHPDTPLYTIPTGSMAQIPVAQVRRGDANCDGIVTPTDVLHVLEDSMGLPSGGICLRVSGDVTCDGYARDVDALSILRFVSEDPLEPEDGCSPIGEPQPASLPPEPTPTPSSTPTPAPTPSGSAPSSPSTSPQTESGSQSATIPLATPSPSPKT